jgi:hypothetical protein
VRSGKEELVERWLHYYVLLSGSEKSLQSRNY